VYRSKDRFFGVLVEASKLVGEGKSGIVELLIQEGKPWHKYRDELIESFDYYGFAVQFGWTDEFVDSLKEERPERYAMYKAILKGVGMVEGKK
jgi:hypothetical protein